MAGGAGGIGGATSNRLGTEGALVAVADLDEGAAREVAAQITAAGGEAFGLAIDIGDEGSVVAAVQATTKAFGGLDAVHVNAADLSPDTIMHDSDAVSIDLDIFDRTIRTNLRGHLLCTRHALPVLLGRGGGGLVYTSSAAAFIGEPSRPAYAMAKSGINALVRHVASKWGKQGVRANAVAPGLVLTEKTQAGLDPSFRQMALRETRSPRLGRPDDIAAMVAFLLSSDGEWINGQVISVDGGATLR
jgi:NAD(P)-dependent dehydrogenase (short-subunit alcohol dehydrogenase family)